MTIKKFIIDVLFPPICLNCGKYLNNEENNGFICFDCLNLTVLNTTLFCPICQARLAENAKICHLNSKYLLAAAGDYNDPIIQKLLHFLKYKGFTDIVPILSELVLGYFKNLRLNFDNFIIIPIPLHSKRERQRGFNQAKLLAEYIGKKLDIETIDGLIRIKNNPAQVKLKGIENRIKNMFGCFQIKNAEQITGKNVILVDDVFTTGATINEAVKILKENGVRKIIALVVAKT